MDLRIQKTKNSIFSAFIELRAAKPLEKITIRELTQKANISKQTFYLHFKDIYDLSEYLENDAITSLVADIPNPDLIITDPLPQPDCSVPHLSHRDICSTFFSRMMTEAAACSPTNWKPALRN